MSEQVDFMVLIPFTSVLMLPLVVSKAPLIQKYLFVLYVSKTFLEEGIREEGEDKRWVVHDSADVFLVRTDVVWIAVENFAYCVDSSY